MSGSDLGKKRQMMYQMDLALNEQLPRYLPQWLVWYAMQGLTWWIQSEAFFPSEAMWYG
jgi:hypothetical protein